MDDQFGPGGASEALYLDSLTLFPGSTLDLNNQHLYVCDLDLEGGAILNGSLISLCPGDADGNWKVDSADLALWQQNYNPLGVGYSTSFPSSESVPEPATLLLVGTGLLTFTGLLRRRAM